MVGIKQLENYVIFYQNQHKTTLSTIYAKFIIRKRNFRRIDKFGKSKKIGQSKTS